MVNIQVSKAPFSLGEINCGPRKLSWLAYIMPVQVGQVSHLAYMISILVREVVIAMQVGELFLRDTIDECVGYLIFALWLI
jgi:uncharacterized membrane protein